MVQKSQTNTPDASEQITLTLVLKDQSEVECRVLTVFDAGKHQYVALLPLGTKEQYVKTMFLYRYRITNHGEAVFEDISDVEEYDLAADMLSAISNDQRIGELVS